MKLKEGIYSRKIPFIQIYKAVKIYPNARYKRGKNWELCMNGWNYNEWMNGWSKYIFWRCWFASVIFLGSYKTTWTTWLIKWWLFHMGICDSNIDRVPYFHFSLKNLYSHKLWPFCSPRKEVIVVVVVVLVYLP